MDRLNKTVATDTFFADCPAHDDSILGHGGATMVQLYVGTTSQVTEVYPMKDKSQMSGTFMDFIRTHGAPKMLFSDNAKEQIGHKILDILRHYNIKRHTSEPHYQNQNPAERRIQDVKHMTMGIMDRTRTPAPFWLLCILYVCYLLNHVASDQLDGVTPLEKAHRQKSDISVYLIAV